MGKTKEKKKIPRSLFLALILYKYQWNLFPLPDLVHRDFSITTSIFPLFLIVINNESWPIWWSRMNLASIMRHTKILVLHILLPLLYRLGSKTMHTTDISVRQYEIDNIGYKTLS